MQQSEGPAGRLPIPTQPSGTPSSAPAFLQSAAVGNAIQHGARARCLLPGFRCGGRLMVAARAASLGLRCGSILAARLPAASQRIPAAAFSTQPSSVPKPGFAPGAPGATPPPPGTAPKAPGAAPPAPASGAAKAAPTPAPGSSPLSSSSPPPPGGAAGGSSSGMGEVFPAPTVKSRKSWVGWAIPVIGLPLMAAFYNYQKEYDKAWDEKVEKWLAEFKATQRTSPPGTNVRPPPVGAKDGPVAPPPPSTPPTPPPPPPPPPAPAPAPASAPAPAQPAPIEPAAKPAAKPAAPAPQPQPAAEAATPAPAVAAPSDTEAAGAILSATEAATAAASPPADAAPAPAPAAAEAPAPAAAAAAADAAAPKGEEKAAAPAPRTPAPSPAPSPAPEAAVAAATAAALALLQTGAVPTAPLPPSLPPGQLGLEGRDLSPLGLIQHAVTSAGAQVTDWSQWPERHAQAVADSRFMHEALTAVAKWHQEQMGQVRGELAAAVQRSEQLQSAGEAAVTRFKELLRQVVESSKEMLELEVRQAEKRTRLESEKTRLVESTSRGEQLEALRLAVGALGQAHEARVRQAAAARAGHALAAGLAAAALTGTAAAALAGDWLNAVQRRAAAEAGVAALNAHAAATWASIA
ncbi:hypothetical protein PLESTM_000912300 [Pleodorina starrii]|nr:hypothetical protein PLESTM_000912300 [Pleodorina starrii]